MLDEGGEDARVPGSEEDAFGEKGGGGSFGGPDVPARGGLCHCLFLVYSD